MNDIETKLHKAMKGALLSAEEKSDIVVTGNIEQLSETLIQAIKPVYSGEIFSPEELFLFSQLASECAKNDKAFYGELESVTGFNQIKLIDLANKLKSLSGL